MAGSSEVIAPGRVAVVTGAASGIGLGLCERLAAEGMDVVMADVEEPALAEAAAKLTAAGASVLAVPADVSDPGQVADLRDQAVAAFGAVHLVANNAGVGGPHGLLWELPAGDWEWVLRVNLGGVINGVRAFIPLLARQDAAHMINTASVFGAFAGALGPYGVSKHAIVALTETLYFQLREHAPGVGLSVLCPGAVRTRFGSSARNRPSWAGPDRPLTSEEQASARQFDQIQAAAGADPAQVAAAVVDGVRSGRFYILTSENRNDAIRRRGEQIVAGGPPAPPFP
jgi:NAD(P)-dependent dehydrogenase (short-subunit alcohol dehydrogenase family)